MDIVPVLLDDDGGSVRVADASFRTVPKDTTAFLIWKITENAAELLPRIHCGTFYDTDAYLVYSASLPGQPSGPDVIRREIKENGNGEYSERHIHAWAGERSGTLGALALRRGAQLATHLGAPVVIHRETSTKESPRLMSYFKDGIRILRSGMNNQNAKLYRVRGYRPLLIQLEQVSCSQLATDGVFVLDAPTLLVLWLGRTANLLEKILGAKIAYRMARGADKGMNARRIAIAHDGYEQTLPVNDRLLVESILELRGRGRVRANRVPSVVAPPRVARLYRATHHPHALPHRPAARLEEIKRAPLYREDLSDDGVYVVDGGSVGVWAWVGCFAPAACERSALAAARGLARAKRHFGAVSAVPWGREPLEFASLFHNWKWHDPRRDERLRVARCATTKLDAVNLATNAWLAAEAQLPDDGSGALRVWRVRPGSNNNLREVARPQNAIFFDADCFIALYTYHSPNGDHSILYYWMGGSSPNDLRNLGAKEAKDLFLKLGRLPVQAWVYQGKEPAHFLQIFKGRMITYIGSATDYDPSGRRVVPPCVSLVRVSGQYVREARGTEAGDGAPVPPVPSGACFLLREGPRAFVWTALCATGDEREIAKNMAPKEHTLVMQGKEKEDFWKALGDRKHLLKPTPLKEVEKPLPPRLFYVSIGAPGQYDFEEIISFSQFELVPEMVAILDAHCTIYVWLGSQACVRAKDDPRAVGLAYLDADPASRDHETPIISLAQGREPPNFTGFFPHWKQTMWKNHRSFSAIISALEGKAIVQNGCSTVQRGNSANRFDQHEKYPLALLRGPKEHLPQDVDPLVKELYLTHDDFVSTFGIPYGDFKALPTWKQKDLKKAVGLF